ncbi:metallophosphoesterase [Infirmifilum lucidum]|nr:metallophosphoesterase [Infirmifilum lucidum]
MLNRRRFLSLAVAGGLFSLAGLALRDSTAIDVRRVEVDLGFGLTLMLVTDTHLHGWGWREKLVKRALEEGSREADVLVFLGDGYDSFSPSPEIMSRLLSDLDLPKLGVLGNHEHWASDKFPLEKGLEAYRKAGVEILTNRSLELMGVKFGGVDWYHDEASLGRSYLREVGKVDVLLSHTPDVIGLDPEASLVLAGHTHGGQVCLPLIGPLWTPSRYGTKYASGLFEVEGRRLYVSRGLGEAAFLPVRLNCPRELTLIRI